MIDVLGPEKRRRRTTQEKIAIVQQSFEPGMTVSLVARQHGVAASQLFLWRKQYQEGSLTADATRIDNGGVMDVTRNATNTIINGGTQNINNH
ncbi:transposase, partial [Shigella sonnei]|uniref:transposase n=1 Tax=Shigella sonnei TaxID=624 RepID=UPI000AF48EB6